LRVQQERLHPKASRYEGRRKEVFDVRKKEEANSQEGMPDDMADVRRPPPCQNLSPEREDHGSPQQGLNYKIRPALKALDQRAFLL
jgi:hypothetical protein